MTYRYRILSADCVSDLEKAVNKLLEAGWKVSGGVSVTQSDCYSENHKGYAEDNFKISYHQAIFKE